MSLENRLVAQTAQCAMGTVMTHKAFGLLAKDSLVAVYREVARLEGLLSRFLPDSEISRVNGSAGTQKEFGIFSAYSNLGGNVVTVGAKPDGSPWHVGIQHPRQENKLIGSVSVVDQTVVTSGDYQRCFTDAQGKRHHHILDPTTGYPSESGLISVSIVTAKSVAADALSTILFVAGMEKGLAFLKSFPQTEAILVDSNLNVYVTQGPRYHYQAANGIPVTILE